MRSLRAVLVTVPPLVADLIRRTLAGRATVAIVAEIPEPSVALAQLPALLPDIVIVGDTGRAPALHADSVRAAVPGARVFVLSADLMEIYGPGADDVIALTPATLADRIAPPPD